MQNSRAVHLPQRHIHIPGDDGMKKEYAATYKFGNTTVNVVAPPPMTEEEKQKVLRDFYAAAWRLWESLTDEQKLQLNAEAEAEEAESMN